jgi:hypothetical protein
MRIGTGSRQDWPTLARSPARVRVEGTRRRTSSCSRARDRLCGSRQRTPRRSPLRPRARTATLSRAISARSCPRLARGRHRHRRHRARSFERRRSRSRPGREDPCRSPRGWLCRHRCCRRRRSPPGRRLTACARMSTSRPCARGCAHADEFAGTEHDAKCAGLDVQVRAGMCAAKQVRVRHTCARSRPHRCSTPARTARIRARAYQFGSRPKLSSQSRPTSLGICGCTAQCSRSATRRIGCIGLCSAGMRSTFPAGAASSPRVPLGAHAPRRPPFRLGAPCAYPAREWLACCPRGGPWRGARAGE